MWPLGKGGPAIPMGLIVGRVGNVESVISGGPVGYLGISIQRGCDRAPFRTSGKNTAHVRRIEPPSWRDAFG